MIFKIIGIAVVMISASLIGCGFAECMASRARELENLADAVGLLVNELEYTLEPVKFLFAKAAPHAKGAVSDFFGKIAELTESDYTAGEAWCAALDSAAGMCLTKSDCAYLKNCSDAFLAHEAEQQRLRLEALRDKIHTLAQRAGALRDKNGKLVRMLGVYGGVLICAVLF